MTLAYPIINYDFNTVSSAEAILALDSYARAMKSFLSGAVEIDQLTGNDSRKLDLTPGLYPEAELRYRRRCARLQEVVERRKSAARPLLSDHRKRLRPRDRHHADQRRHRGRARVPQRGQPGPVTTAKLGEELTVVLRVRSTDDQNLENVAIEDLLPGGFEIVEESVHSGACTDWGEIEYVDVREDGWSRSVPSRRRKPK